VYRALLKKGKRAMRITDAQRELFDELLDLVIEELPASVRDLLDEVPLVVDDRPSRRVLEELGIERPSDLQGLYTGVSLPERHLDAPAHLPDRIQIFRLGILRQATRRGQLNLDDLKEEIRITIMHEIGHHFGLDEDDLREVGYD